MLRTGSDLSPLRHGRDFGGADDQVVQQPDVHQGQGLLQLARQGDVGRAGFRQARGVVVGQNQGGGVVLQRGLHDLARVDRGVRQRAARDLGAFDQPQLAVQEQGDAVFHPQVRQAQGAGGTTPLPTPDALGSIAMSGTAGKVALRFLSASPSFVRDSGSSAKLRVPVIVSSSFARVIV